MAKPFNNFTDSNSNDCNITQPKASTCNYPRAYISKILNDFKLLKHNQSCNPNPADPCILDNTGLVVPNATPNLDIVKDNVITISNISITKLCSQIYTPTVTDTAYTFINDTKTVAAGSFIRTLINPTTEEQAAAQSELNATADAYVSSLLNCGYTNAALTLACPRDLNLYNLNLQPIGESSMTLSAQTFSSYFKDFETDITTSAEVISATANDIKSKSFTYLTSTIQCTYGNPKITAECTVFPSQVTDPDDTEKSYSTTDVVATVTKFPSTLEANTITDTLSYTWAYITDANGNKTWNIATYRSINFIQDESTYKAYELAASVIEGAKTQLAASTTCDYGNTDQIFLCPLGYTAIDAGTASSIMHSNSYIVSKFGSELISVIYPLSSDNVRLQIYVPDPLAYSIYDTVKTSEEANKALFFASNCAIFNNTLHIYCDKSTAAANTSAITTQPIRVSEYLAGSSIESSTSKTVLLYLNDYPIDQQHIETPADTYWNYPFEENPTSYDECSKTRSPISLAYNKSLVNNVCVLGSQITTGYPNFTYTSPSDNPGYTAIQNRIANSDAGVTDYIIPSRTFSIVYSTTTESAQSLQKQANQLAVEQGQAAIACLYGNIKIFEETCDKFISCPGSAFFAHNINAPEVTENSYLADSPTNADRQAVIAHTAMSLCLCADWTGGGGSNVSMTLDGSCSSTCSEKYCVFAY